MYAHFYNLTESPFNLTPDPKFHYVNEPTREAMASILHGIKARKGFLTLIGEAGTGKTTLLKRILDEIEGETRVVFVFNPGVSFDELLEFICGELGIITSGSRRLHLLERLNAFLLEQLTAGSNVVVMIDEAQTLEDSVLEELRLLSNLETAKEKILQILLSGQPELEEKLRRPGLRQLRQRIAVRATLKPMRPDEIGPYVETRLRIAGADQNDLFTPAALRKVWHASRGIARIVNVVCDNAMMIAFAEGKRRITGAVMSEAVRDLDGQGGSNVLEAVRDWMSLASVRYAAGAAVGIAAAVALAMYIAPDDDSSSVAAPPAVQSPEQAAVGVAGPVAAASAERTPAAASDPQSTVPPAAATEPAEDPNDFRLSGALRDQIRRAEVLARSTAARLYDTANQEPQPKVAEPPPVQPTSAERLASEPIVLRSAPNPPAPLRQPGAAATPNAEQEAVAALREPVKTGDASLFDIEPGMPVTEPASGEQRERKPVKAGQVEVAASRARVIDPAPVEPVPPSPQPAREEPPVKPAAKPVPAEPPARVARATPAPSDDGPRTNLLGPAAGTPPLGQLVRVMRGDTVWDIAIAYYGTAGPSTLKRVLNNNPGIRDPRRLEAGTYVYLPFERADQMVQQGPEGSYRLLLAVSPDQRRLDAVQSWLESFVDFAEFRTSSISGADRRYQLHLVNLATRESALEFADGILARHRVR